MLNRRGARADPCETPFLRRRNLLLWPFPVVREKLRWKATWKGSNNIPRFCNEPHLLHVLFVKVAPGTTFTSWSKHHFVVIGKVEQQVRKTSHCCTKQQWRSHVVIILFLLVHATWVLFIMLIPFVVNRTFNTMLTERLQHLHQGWVRLFEMTESERDK